MRDAATGGMPGLPGPQEHPSVLFTLLAIIIEVGTLISLVLVTKYTVTHRSGLNEPDKIHRIWARAPEIRFQPVVRPMIFAVAVSFGAPTVLHTLVVSLPSLIGIPVSPIGFFSLFLMFLVTGASSFISIVIYRATGGAADWKLCALATLGFDSFMLWVLILTAQIYRKVFDDETVSVFFVFLVMFVLPVLFLGLIQLPFALIGANKKIPATARLIYNSTVVPSWVKLDRTILVAAGPLTVVHLLGYVIQNHVGSHSYLSHISFSLASLMLLAVSALASIISVNRALLANEFQWQWRAFLTPAIPLGSLDVLLSLINVIRGRSPPFLLFYQLPHLFMSYGSCGTLGAYVYLALAERYAQGHMDDDTFAQQDLLDEFEEDEDNEELHV